MGRMKTRPEQLTKKGANPHDHSGHAAGVCPKCRADVPAKPGFRTSSLKCPKCGSAPRKR